MTRHILRAVVLAAALLPAAWAVAAPLSLDQAVDLAVQRSQLTRSARAGALSAAEMARVAGQQPDPMLNVGIDNVPATGSSRLSTNAEDMTMKRIGIVQEWVSAEKRSAREAAAQALAGRESVMERIAAAEARQRILVNSKDRRKRFGRMRVPRFITEEFSKKREALTKSSSPSETMPTSACARGCWAGRPGTYLRLSSITVTRQASACIRR